ncbi:MAG: hypothetical protein BWY70_01357 [Bacteroidetes bacterium ADurb.Bin408]|nr:MAG: hypothetical protein BWY70_01357 [Bacteroidetes bacterium ADurb.Bin408]
METSNKKDRLRGILGTVLFHGILLVAFLFLGLRTPLPLPEEEGVEVRMGDLNGMGVIDYTPPPAHVPPLPSNPVKTEDKNLTQNTDDAPRIEEIKKPVKNESPVKNEQPVKEQVKDPVVNNNMLFKPGNKNGHNQGNTNIPGYQGNPNGNPNSGEPQGSQGNGISFSLSGRSSKNIPHPEYNSPEQGTVVVSITVDKNGKVIKAIPGAKGTTTTDGTLRRLAEQAALKATFDANPNAPEEQIGTITYKFIRLN